MGLNPLYVFLGTLFLSSFIQISIANSDFYWNQGLSTPEECYRECRVGAPPKTCYYHFTLEYYSTVGGACGLCSPNNTNILSNTCQCVPADGVERTIISVNRKLPGPSIQVCLGDKIVVDVENMVDGTEVSIHWHGVFQSTAQYFDGVPLVTQCPILHGNTFRYQFLAENEGTHFWHSHDGMSKMDGIHGSLIVRVPLEEEPNSELYDHDLAEHVVLFVDWMHELTAEHTPGLLFRNPLQHPDSLLIAGRGDYLDPDTGINTNSSLAVFNVQSGYKYRFRFINAFCSVCIAELAIESHPLTLIATDGVPLQPKEINTFHSLAGERFDFVINANQTPGCYHILLRGLGGCSDAKIKQTALLCYDDKPIEETITERPTWDTPYPPGVILGPLDGICNITRENNICINQLRSARHVDKKLLTEVPDHTFFFEIDFFTYLAEQLFAPNTYQKFSVPGGGFEVRSRVNNISFVSPTSPLLSQIEDISPNTFCDRNNLPQNCVPPCACTQMYNITKGASVEIVLSDGIGVSTLIHPIHLHGYAFNVIGMGIHPNTKVKKMRAYQARDLDRRNLLCRNFKQPPYKDTVGIPTGGYVVIRFRADNPGYWLMHCHFLFHQLIGMEFLLHVGEQSDLPPVPKDFPKCGNYLPPIEPAKQNCWN